MNRFNLTFSGEILPGQEPEQVKRRFSKMFAIDDPVRLERFFSGQTIILRRNLERKEAAGYFQDLHKLGVVAALVKVTASEVANTITAKPTPSRKPAKSEAPSQVITPTPDRQKAGVVDARANTGTTVKTPVATPLNEAQETNLAEENRRQALEEQAREAAEITAQLQLQAIAQSQQKAQRKVQEEAEQAEAQQQAAETEAQRTAELAELEEQQRLKAEQAAQKKAAKAAAKRKAAAQRKTKREQEKAERARLQAEETARLEAAEAEKAARLAAEKAGRLEAEKAARLEAENAARLAAEEAARLAAEEAARLAAEKEARQKALREEAQRKAEEEAAARRKAELEEQLRREAEALEQKRLAAEALAKRKAEEKERQRREAAAAKRQAELEEEKRRAAAATAKRQAELEEKRRRAAEEADKLEAERQARKRLEEQEAARLAAELLEIQQQEIEAEARVRAELEEIKRQETTETARLHAEFEAREKETTAAAARIKSAAVLKKAEAQRKSAERLRAVDPENETAALLQPELPLTIADPKIADPKTDSPTEEQSLTFKPDDVPNVRPSELSQNSASPPPAVVSAATPRSAEQAIQSTGKAAKARVKTNLELPQRSSSQGSQEKMAPVRKRQPGEANLFQLRPFRNTVQIRGRAEKARKRLRIGLTVGGLALAALLAIAGAYLRFSPAAPLHSVDAIAVSTQSGPVLLAEDTLLLHDRAGIDTTSLSLDSLGVLTLEAPLTFDDQGRLFARGQLSAESMQATNPTALSLLRCDLKEPKCQNFAPHLAEVTISAFAVNTVNGDVIIADASAGQLLKLSANGEDLARADLAIPERPVLYIDSGLLLMNSLQGSAISVIRYDDSAFGQQLDEILLRPPPAVRAAQDRVTQILRTGTTWWISLHNELADSTGLYRFDAQWDYLGEAALNEKAGALQLARWGEKTLANDLSNVPLLRFNATGVAEAPFISRLLEDKVAQRQRNLSITALAWRLSFLTCALLATAGLIFSYLQALRKLVYKPGRETGAVPIDDFATQLQWLDPVPNRESSMRRLSLSYGALVLAALLIAISQNINAVALAALLAALCGPAIALMLLSKPSIGHIAVFRDKLLLVDHRGLYHLGGGSRVQYRGAFLLLDDVVVFTGNRLLPAFSPEQLQSLVRPLATGGVKVDRHTLQVKLLEARHPLAQGALAILTTTVLALALLFLPGLL